jgi:tRNA modification GTPase
MSTIFALATPAGRSGVAVIRISGPDSASVLRALTREALPKARFAARRKFWRGDVLIDDGLVLWFPAPNSFTGEDVAEFHIHGGPAVIAAMAETLRAQGLKLAEPGAFTRRAFDNGKLDLTEVEGLADLIAAETEAQRRQALRQMEGELGALYESWRKVLLHGLAQMEAAIDFPDEDLPTGLVQSVDEMLRSIAAAISQHLDDAHRGERLRDGLSVVILGAPNVGKSSLLNRLARRDAAIVSAQAGTTRDVIEVRLDLGGYPVLIADTAGLRATPDEIEAEGVRRALQRAEHADLKLLLFDGGAWPAVPAETARLIDDAAILVLNKADLAGGVKPAEIAGRALIPVSAKSGAGLEALLADIGRRAQGLLASGDAPILTRLRHREALENCLEALQTGLQAPLIELKSEDLRHAVQALGRITGRVDVEDVLDVIFREFCIGK